MPLAPTFFCSLTCTVVPAGQPALFASTVTALFCANTHVLLTVTLVFFFVYAFVNAIVPVALWPLLIVTVPLGFVAASVNAFATPVTLVERSYPTAFTLDALSVTVYVSSARIPSAYPSVIVPVPFVKFVGYTSVLSIGVVRLPPDTVNTMFVIAGVPSSALTVFVIVRLP